MEEELREAIAEAEARVTTLLYRLLRDQLPVGAIEAAVREIAVADMRTHNPALWALAKDFALDLVPEPPTPEPRDVFLANAPLRILEELHHAEGPLSLAELASASGWDAGLDYHVDECQQVLAELYDGGYVQRMRLGTADPTYLSTADGVELMNKLRS